jgi:hypothetical protein
MVINAKKSLFRQDKAENIKKEENPGNAIPICLSERIEPQIILKILHLVDPLRFRNHKTVIFLLIF